MPKSRTTPRRLDPRRLDPRRLLAVLAVGVLTGVGLAAPSPASADTRATRYIVSTDSIAGTEQALSVLSRSGTRARHRFDRVLPGFAADLTATQVAALRSNRQVRSVVPDQQIHLDSTQTNPPWGLDRIDQGGVKGNGSYTFATRGAGVTVYEIDTGIRFSHTQFGGRASSGYDWVDGDGDASDCNGHGTHVAGTIGGKTYGVAKSVNVVALRVLDCDGNGWDSDFISALQWVTDHHSGTPSVVNISAGGEAYSPMDKAVEAVVAAGVPVVVAAGNDNKNACSYSPGRTTNAITVAATTVDDERASYSNYGSCVDVSAPGSNVKSAWDTSDTAYRYESGTSMATPHVAGAIARYLGANPTATPAGVRKALVGDATPNALSGVGSGSPNRVLYLRRAVPGGPRLAAITPSDSAHTATLTWTFPYGFGSPAPTGYRLTIGEAGGSVLDEVDTEVPASPRNHVFTGLRPGTTYTVTLRALIGDNFGSAATKTVTMR